jgi:hypothetical protein
MWFHDIDIELRFARARDLGGGVAPSRAAVARARAEEARKQRQKAEATRRPAGLARPWAGRIGALLRRAAR